MMKRLTYVAGAIAMALLLEGASCGGGSGPGPVPTPTPPPPVNQAKYLNLLLRIDGVTLVRPNSAEEFKPFGAVQCCMGTEANGQEINTLWPLASESWMDYSKANMFHFRMGPFYGDADHESEWTGIGGAYAGGPGSDWNPAFWDKVVALTEYAGSKGANVEVNVIDTWYCKRAQWGDQQIPWPAEDIQACGRSMTPGQERFIRKTVSTLGLYANVIWITDNEGGEISQTKRAWYEAVAAIIRDEESKAPVHIVRLIGTNNTDFADGPFDYVATHDKAPLLSPIAGKHTENNERNPAFSVGQEYANFCNARKAGLNYWFWRAEMSQSDADKLLALMRNGCDGDVVTGCYAPDSEDPKWEYVCDPRSDASCPPSGVNGWTNAARQAVGDRRGQDGFETLDLLGADIRKQGHCSSDRWRDAIAVRRPDGLYEERHEVAFTDGGYTQRPYVGLWKYNGTAPGPVACSIAPPAVDEILCKEHQATNHIWDCTPKANGQPIRPEGTTDRAACEAEACGGTPTFSLSESTGLELSPRTNPYQFKLSGSGQAKLHGTCPRTGSEDLVDRVISQQVQALRRPQVELYPWQTRRPQVEAYE